tara:strand:- start:2074 stop:2625 length:552 start_codon:yes stop_codon:yes gene_type:complete
MQFDKTIQAMQFLGNNVVKESRSILKKKKKQTKSNALYRGLDYLVTAKQNTVTLEFEFGRAEDYWQFVDEGVKGAGGFKGSGRMRGQGSPFRFRKKNIAKGVVEKWIANKPLRLRGTDGKFMAKTKNNIKSAAFLIGRAIAQRGLERTQFFSKPFTQQFTRQADAIVEALADDIELNLKQSLT